MFNILVEQFPLPKIDIKEVLRYAAIKGTPDEHIQNVINECILEASSAFMPKVCYTTLPSSEFYTLVPSSNESMAIHSYLEGCDSVVMFAATVGLEIDRLIHRYATTSTVKALFFQALGAERIEALCDEFSSKLFKSAKESSFELKPRFSPGYGDFSIVAQRELFSLLKPERNIGLTLTDSLMMTPTKSVTAIIGLKTK